MSSEDLKAAAKYVQDNLAPTAQMQLLLECIQCSVNNKPTKEKVLLLTNRRVIIMRRKTGLLRGLTVKNTYSMLDIFSLEIIDSGKAVQINFRCQKEHEVVVLRASAASVQRITTIIYDGLRVFHNCRIPQNLGAVKIPPSTAANSHFNLQTSLVELYMSLCDQNSQIPLLSYIEYIQHVMDTGDTVLDIADALGKKEEKSGTIKVSSSDLRIISLGLRNQTHFRTVLVDENIHLQEEALDSVLGISLSPQNRITKLAFMGNNWSKGLFKRVGAHIEFAAKAHLREFLVYHNHVGDEGIQILLKSLIEAQMSIKTLVLNHCQISGKDEKALLPILHNLFISRPNGIRVFDLGGNELAKKGCRVLSDFVASSECLLRLSLAYSQINVSLILESLSANKALYQHRLEMLNLSGLKLSKEAALLLRSMLATTSSLKEVTLNRAKINQFALANIFDAIGNNGNDVQMMLDLSSCGLGREVAKVLGDSTRRHGPFTNLSMLSLQFNDIGSLDAVQDVSDALSQVPSLKHLAFDGNIEPPNLFNKKKIMELGNAIAGLVKTLPGILSLSLRGSENNYCGDGLVPILLAIGEHPSLNSLDISRNRLTRKGFVALSTCLSRSKSLDRLDMDNNDLDTESMELLANAISSNNELPLRSIDIRTSLASVASQRKRKKMEAVLSLASSLQHRIRENREKGVNTRDRVPASMQRRLLSVERLESCFADVFEDDDANTYIDAIVTISAKQLASQASSNRGRTISRTATAASEAATDANSALSDAQFGVLLENVEMVAAPNSYAGGIPAVLVQMDAYLDENGALDSVGIFRLAPDENESKRVKAELNEGTFEVCSDVNSVANNLKVWYRDLPNKILASVALEEMAACTRSEQVEEIIEKMPEPEKSVFEWTLDVFVKYTLHADNSKMNAKNVSIVFSPNLYPSNPDDPMADMQSFQQVCRFTEKAINYRQGVYDEARLEECHSVLQKMKETGRRSSFSHSQGLGNQNNSNEETSTSSPITSRHSCPAATYNNTEEAWGGRPNRSPQSVDHRPRPPPPGRPRRQQSASIAAKTAMLGLDVSSNSAAPTQKRHDHTQTPLFLTNLQSPPSSTRSKKAIGSPIGSGTNTPRRNGGDSPRKEFQSLGKKNGAKQIATNSQLMLEMQKQLQKKQAGKKN